MSLLRRIWLAIIHTELDLEVNADMLRRRFERIQFATIIMELPMAFADDIAALDKEITDVLAAKDAEGATNATDLAAAKVTITDLQTQLAANEAQLQALVAKYAPPLTPPAM